MAITECHGIVHGLEARTEWISRYSRGTVYYFRVDNIAHRLPWSPIDPNSLIEFDAPFCNGDEMYTVGFRGYNGEVNMNAAVAIKNNRVVFVKDPQNPKIAFLCALLFLSFAIMLYFSTNGFDKFQGHVQVMTVYHFVLALFGFFSVVCIFLAFQMMEIGKRFKKLKSELRQRNYGGRVLPP